MNYMKYSRSGEILIFYFIGILLFLNKFMEVSILNLH
jgi:hypothetical protein